MTDPSRIHTPTLPGVSPTCALTSYLQQQYPDYFQNVFGIPASDPAVAETKPRPADPTGQFESSDPCPKTVDQYQDTGMYSSIQGPNVAENQNTSSLGCKPAPGKSTVSPPHKAAKLNVCKKGQVKVANLPTRSRHPLLTCVTESSVIDFNRKLDLWLDKLKTDIKTDVSRILVQALEAQRRNHQVQTVETIGERQRLEWKVKELQEKAESCRKCIQEKDAVIDNMLEMLATQKNTQALAQVFADTKTGQMHAKAEKFAECLATLHYEHHLTQKVFRAWFGLVKHRWKTTLEGVYRDQAANTCRKLSCDYLKRTTHLNEEISNLKVQLEHMHQEKQTYVMHVKKAFLRGVCALNSETMSAFTLDDFQTRTSRSENQDVSNSCSHAVDIPEKDHV